MDLVSKAVRPLGFSTIEKLLKNYLRAEVTKQETREISGPDQIQVLHRIMNFRKISPD